MKFYSQKIEIVKNLKFFGKSFYGLFDLSVIMKQNYENVLFFLFEVKSNVIKFYAKRANNPYNNLV